MEGPAIKRSKTTAHTQGQLQRIFVLELPNMRQSASGNHFGTCCVLCETSQFKDIHEMFFPVKHETKITKSVKKCLLLKGFSIREDGTLSISENTKIMDTTTDLDLIENNPVVRSFCSPQVYPIAVIKTLKRNERVSVQGTVDKVSGLLETPNSKRRIATISDTSGQIEVKMWGPKKDLITQAGIQVKITGLRIDIFNTRYSLNSTSSTAIETTEEEHITNGVITAACFDQGEMSLMIDDQEYSISTDLMEVIFPLLEFDGNVGIRCKSKGRMITEILDVKEEDLHLD